MSLNLFIYIINRCVGFPLNCPSGKLLNQPELSSSPKGYGGITSPIVYN